MKLKQLMVSWLAICGLLTGCLSEPGFEPVTDDNGVPLEVRLFNEIQQQPVTRVNDEGFCDGDEVGVYVVNYVDGNPGILAVEDNQADNVRYTLDETSGAWTPEVPVYYLDKTTKVDIYGYYPYAEPTDMEAWPFEIAKDQSRDAENGKMGGYEASDFLWAKASEVSPTASKVVLQFHHMMAGVVVTLVEGEGFGSGEFAALEKAALVTNTKRQTFINFSTGEVTATGEIPTTGTIPYKKGDDFRAIVAPQTIAANTPLFSLTVDGIPYVFSKSEDFTYVSGKLHKFSIQIDKKSESGVEFNLFGESITAWESETFTHDGAAREYVVIHCETAGGLKDAIVAAGKDYTKLKNLKITGKVNVNDFFFMRDEMTVLQAVNMKEVKIEALGSNNENEIPQSAFNNKTSLNKFILPESAASIGSRAFYSTNLSGSLVLPDDILYIGLSAFNGCKFSGTLSLPANLEEIGANAFDNQDFIGELDIPDKVKVIGLSAFNSCSSFTSIKLSSNIEKIGSSAFYECTSIRGDLIIPPKVKKIEQSSFGKIPFGGKLILPDGLIAIESSAFWQCGFTNELKLPNSLQTIGDNAFSGCNFSGTLVFPSSLSFIGSNAFENNVRLSGNIEFPHEIISLSSDTFKNCIHIQGVILNSNIQNISPGVFKNCYQLNSIICHAQTPPTIASGAFDGVAKDNFMVEVPEAAVEIYRTAPGWKEFKRISAHHDFLISRAKIRTLNASESKTLVLRAPSGSAWSIESCPEWVTVSPMSGIGKDNVTITVNEMTPSEAGTVTYEQMNSSGIYEEVTFEGRRGDVVFLLEGRDYRSTTVVEQYNYAPEGEVIGDGTVITNQTAETGKGVNLVFMGDCFDAKDISEGKYLAAANEAIIHFFGLPPYEQYRDYFNVYTVVGLSSDSGIGTVNTIREARFGSQYGLQGSGKIAPDAATCFEYACKAPTVTEDNINQTLIVLIENSTDYDGICYMYGDGSAIALCPMSDDAYPYDFRGIVQHEAGGHGFGKLGDEYIYHNAFIQTCNCTDGCGHVDEFNTMKARGWYGNLSLSGNMYDVPWSHFIFDAKYSNVVDVYEGGYFHTRGVFRSEPNSCMNNNVPYYSAVSREVIVKRIMEYAGETYTFEAFKEKDVMQAATTTSVKSGDPFVDMTYPSRHQHRPVYMGERPDFKK